MNQPSASVDSPLVAIVQSLYAAFSRRDIPSLLAPLSPEVEWRINVDPAAPAAKRIPDFRPFRGREGVQAFFSIIEEELTFHSFDPAAFLTGGNHVAVRVKMDLTIKSTGNRLPLDVIHLFIFDANGRISRFIEYMDTLAAAGAWDMIDPKA